MSIESILAVTTSIMGILGVSSLTGLVVAIRKQAKSEAKRDSTIEAIQNDVTDIKQIVGNGAFPGLRRDIVEIKLNCAKEMARVEAQMDFLGKRND